MNRQPVLARRFFDRFEPVHGISYFSPESRNAMDALGFRGFWMGYFAARSAPLGQVPTPVVTALFYNFSPTRVAKALPAAWGITSPTAALQTRRQSAVATLRRYGVDRDDNRSDLETAAALAAKAARSAPGDGRAMFAANAALPWPTEPLDTLWHAATLLREHRGDGHVAALLSAGVTGRDANVLHCAAGVVAPDYIKRSRDYDDAEWQQCTESLARRGLLDTGGSLTDRGHQLKDHIENLTNTLALTALAGLDDGEVETLFRVLTPITRMVVAGGDLPATTPMGLRRDELDDDSAHLT